MFFFNFFLMGLNTPLGFQQSLPSFSEFPKFPRCQETYANISVKTLRQRQSCPVSNILTCAPSRFNLMTFLTVFIFTLNSFLLFCYSTLQYALFKCKLALIPLKFRDIHTEVLNSVKTVFHYSRCRAVQQVYMLM